MVNPEICTGHLNFRDRDSHFIFGDACTAVIVERADLAAVSYTHLDVYKRQAMSSVPVFRWIRSAVATWMPTDVVRGLPAIGRVRWNMHTLVFTRMLEGVMALATRVRRWEVRNSCYPR